MYLLDTDVLSITNPASGLSEPQAQAWRDWVRRNERVLYFSTVTIMEVRFGVERAREGRKPEGGSFGTLAGGRRDGPS